MSSLFALLQSQSTPLQTRKGLIILGLQNDFVLPDGKLPVNDTGYLDRIIKLVPSFREHGDLIWVRSEFEGNRQVNGFDTPGDTVIAGKSYGRDTELSPSSDHNPVPTKKFKVAPDFSIEGWALQADQPKSTSKSKAKSTATLPEPKDGDDDEELFLTRTTKRQPCCIRGTRGAEMADKVKPLIDPKDLQVVKSHYSAFGGTSLLMTLRSKLITDLYVCGNMTNLSVYATAMDAARYGIQITLITDCLGYRKQDRHDLAIKQLREIVSAEVIKCDKVIDALQNPPEGEEYSEEEDDGDQEEDDEEEDVSEDESDGPDVDEQPKPGHDNHAAPTNPELLEKQQSNDQQVDSEESDGEFTLPAVRPIRRLDPPIELPFRRADGGMVGRISSSQFTQPPSSQSHRRSLSGKQPAPRSFHGSRNELVQPHLYTASSHRRLGVLDSPDSPPKYDKPWLQLIAPTPAATSGPAIQNKPSHRGLAAIAGLAGLPQSTISEYETMMKKAQEEQKLAEYRRGKSKPLFGENTEVESDWSRISYDLLPPDLAETVFDKLKAEVHWQSMYHQTGEVPRLVCCQGTIDEDGSMPVYRHPADQTISLQPWTRTVDWVRKAAEARVGHPLNHVLIQLYRSGNDLISEHSDKTPDIAAGSNIVNVSFGAQRTMRLRTKRGALKGEAEPLARTTHRIPMPHNSMITMSLKTNARYLHGINADKRPQCELTEAEKAYDGQRISLTFRNIATFLDGDSKIIWGQGATGKTKDDARLVINGNPEMSERMVRAFGAENAASTIDWGEIYGEGFDLLHLK
ncbi:hypothetical protein PRZ48_004891 [Zasmidium cellare]|uniref:Fe2OG dioxygenase domain-containing protein n=1 Tax=Zasmidium cellare TaxID=395010 RepID=A0ABR0ES73_ZASCE|nr:hypothetical protein PRZ48_004891 [Zasmidium cellare]